jgi:hypothetical protein
MLPNVDTQTNTRESESRPVAVLCVKQSGELQSLREQMQNLPTNFKRQ